MHHRFLSLVFLLALAVAAPVRAQDAGQPADSGAPSTTGGTQTGEQGQQQPQSEQKTELDLPIDDSIKVTIEPLAVSSLVDRVLEPCTVRVKCAGAVSAEVFIFPVDSPYGGFARGNPRSLGRDSKPEDGLSVRWQNKESDRYVKLFAVVRRKASPDAPVRSRLIDLAIGGARYEPAKGPH